MSMDFEQKQRLILVVIDAASGAVLPDDRDAPNVRGFIGWKRLAAVLRDTGEVQDTEDLIQMIVTDGGIELAVKRKEPKRKRKEPKRYRNKSSVR
jgi:hypothetical protein